MYQGRFLVFPWAIIHRVCSLVIKVVTSILQKAKRRQKNVLTKHSSCKGPFKTAFTWCWNILKMRKNVTEMAPVHMKTFYFLQAGFENRTLARTFWKRRRENTPKWWKRNIFAHFQNDTSQFLISKNLSLALSSWGGCKQFATVKVPTVFKLCWYRVKAS